MDDTTNNEPKRPAYGPGSGFHGKAGRSGPRVGNLNALTNGSKLQRRRLTVGELPKNLISARKEGRAYRLALEKEVLAVKGEIDVVDAHHIDTAAAATIQAAIVRWLLRHKIAEMTTGDIRNLAADIVKAKERRDASVKMLDLKRKPAPLELKDYLANGDHADGRGGAEDK